MYCLYASVDEKSLYKIGYVGTQQLPQFYTNGCTRTMGAMRKTQQGVIFSCDQCNAFRYVCLTSFCTSVFICAINSSYIAKLYIYCQNIHRTSYGRKLRKMLRDRGAKLLQAVEFTKKSEITPIEMKLMDDFTEQSVLYLSEERRDLKNRIKLAIEFYNSISSGNEADVVATSSGYIPGVDAFLDSFIKHYSANEEYRGSLMINLLKGYTLKVDGVKNPKYGTKVLNFMLALAASGDKKAFEYVSGNLCSVSLRWIQKLIARKRSAPFIQLSRDDMVQRLVNRFTQIRQRIGNPTQRLAFSVGVDATCVVSAFQLSTTHGVIVGGASSNHYISMDGIDTPEGMKQMLQECKDGDNGDPAAEIKIAVISLQNTAPGLCPYFTLAGLPQLVNENNDFGTEVMIACEEAAKIVGNVAVLNGSTDGVSCEVQWNLTVTQEFLDGKKNYISVPDTNHNVKNSRYQLIGGSSAAVMGRYVFDPWLLKVAGVPSEHIRIDDFASDALPMRLASSNNIAKIINSGFHDVGNCAVTTMSLTFMRLRSYAVNARTGHWRHRAIFSWASFLWFSSFQTPGSTMMANKGNMLLESIGVLSLVTRSDVSQPRRATSECNEHTYGIYRMMQREFNIDQLIGIVDKSNIKVEALYESNLVTSRTHTNFKGYQATFPEFLAAMKSGSIGATAGPVDIDLDIAPVNQLWEEVSGVIAVTNAWMTPFLRLFGVEAGNGLSPFATDINSPSDLRVMIAQFFRAPRRDRRGNNNIDGDVPGDVEDEVDMDVEDEIVEEVNGAVGLLPISVITNHVTEIQQADEEGDESDDDVTVVEENNTTNVVEVEDFLDSGAISAFDYFKTLLMCNNINDVSGCALKLVQLLQLGK